MWVLHEIEEIQMSVLQNQSAAASFGVSAIERRRFVDDFETLADRVARFRISVLITGETGVGKEVLAQRIHEHSPRATRPLITIDCAGLCATLVESELFGYDRGAFTSATQSRAGLFEAAHGGTLFLDEVGELPLAMQAKLLRALETRTVQRLGSTRSRPVDVRFLSATNRDLRQEVREGRFRADLLFRLNGARIHVPPLRERRDEIPRLADEFLARASAAEGLPCPRLSPRAQAALCARPWSGNIRQLRNVMERALAFCDRDTIDLEDLQSGFIFGDDDPDAENLGRLGGTSSPTPVTGAAEPRQIDQAAIVRALQECAGNQTRAAALLGISRRTLVERIKRWAIPRPQVSRNPAAIPRPFAVVNGLSPQPPPPHQALVPRAFAIRPRNDYSPP